MKQRLSAKKLVIATRLQHIPAGGDGAHTGPERRVLSSRRGRTRQVARDPDSTVRDQGRLGLGSHILHIQQLRVPGRTLDRHHMDYTRARRGPDGVDVTLLGWPLRGCPRRAVLVPHAAVQRRRFGAENHG